MGPDPVPLIEMPDWVAGLQAVLSGATGVALADMQVLQSLANDVNPRAGTVNCGWIVDAVVARVTGTDPGAVARNGFDGSWGEIEQRHDTTFAWGSSFHAAFAAVAAGGPGTIALVSIAYPQRPPLRAGDSPPPRGAHVVAVVNQNGTVGVIEGQSASHAKPRGVITSPDEAMQRYNPKSDIGVGIVGAGAPPPPPAGGPPGPPRP
jgi:hypothetical protein